MTSKEALEHIIFDAKMEKPIFSMYYQEFLKPIERDLEVLEILKNKNVDVDLIKNIMKDNRKFECYPDDNLTQEQFELVKEWLENGKIN